MGLPFMSRTRRVMMPGVPAAESVWAVPETASIQANSGRAPRTTKLTHWPVPLRQAVEEVCWPSARGPTESDLKAMPFAPVVDEDVPDTLMLLLACQTTVCPAAGAPLVRAR